MNEEEYQKAFQEWLNSQSGYVGKTKKAEFRNNWVQGQQNQARLQNLFNDQGSTFGISGSQAEQTGRLEGLERAKILTGQNPYQIGADYQEAYGNIKKRAQLADTGSELLRASKAGAVADTKNTLQQQGVKGGAAARAVSEVERQKAYDVNNQLVENQRKAEMDYMNATKANANFTTANEMNFGALNAGRDIQAPNAYSNGFGTVICTHLFTKGYLDIEIMSKDFDYGVDTLQNRPDVYWGYRFLADPIVAGMKRSAVFTDLVAFFAVPWARNMAGDKNLFGAAISFFGEPLCWIVGKIIGGKYANQKTV